MFDDKVFYRDNLGSRKLYFIFLILGLILLLTTGSKSIIGQAEGLL